MRRAISVVVLLFTALPIAAQDSDDPTRRLKVFTNFEFACKAMILAKPDVAKSLVIASRRSLSELCECASLLTVADMSDEDINSLIAADKEKAKFFLLPLSENSARCVQIE